ncbi:MAG TPA: SHOCT domain-containing protein [Acidobacteriota bacterium]|jgi:hypothetical protein|nr:SHOCT domain-containing protein [Acidobacteriota bacterium]MEE3274287.1 SHOCT domain-containing protein [Acidobacteriota bacterium]HJO29672.1 SHOCT domain-containing protein [Acidobacteriota bacterium]
MPQRQAYHVDHGQTRLGDAGVISDEEFEAKKAELMARL